MQLSATQLREDELQPLSDADLRLLLGRNLSIVKYPQLAGARRIEDVLDDQGRCVRLRARDE